MQATIPIIIDREFKNTLQNYYLLGMTVLLATLALSLVMLGNTPFGESSADRLTVQITSLSSLSIFFIPLMALFMSYDAIVGEYEQGSLLLMLSYPVKRYQFLLGKFIANWLSLSLAIILGYSSVLALFVFDTETLSSTHISVYMRLIFTSILLGGVFIALAYLVSVIVRQRSTAIIACIGIWLFFVIFFDMLLLAMLTSDYSYLLSAETLSKVLLFNPVDVFRIVSVGAQKNNLLPLQALSNVVTLSPTVLIVSLCLWVATPLILAIYLFKNKVL